MTKKKRYRRYSPEFKRQALKRASEEGMTALNLDQVRLAFDRKFAQYPRAIYVLACLQLPVRYPDVVKRHPLRPGCSLPRTILRGVFMEAIHGYWNC